MIIMQSRGKVVDGDYKGKHVVLGTALRIIIQGNWFDIVFDRPRVGRPLSRGIIVKWQRVDYSPKNWKDWVWAVVSWLTVLCHPFWAYHPLRSPVWLWVEFHTGERCLIEISEKEYKRFLYQMQYGAIK